MLKFMPFSNDPFSALTPFLPQVLTPVSLGSEAWARDTTERFGLISSLRSRERSHSLDSEN